MRTGIILASVEQVSTLLSMKKVCWELSRLFNDSTVVYKVMGPLICLNSIKYDMKMK